MKKLKEMKGKYFMKKMKYIGMKIKKSKGINVF